MKAQIKPHHGTPTLFLDDQPAFFGCQLLGSFPREGIEITMESVRKFAQAGVHIYSIDAVVHEWAGPQAGVFDFSETAPRLQEFVDNDPQALFLLRMGFETRGMRDNWWNNAHPDELELLSDGTTVGQSFASLVWRQQVKDLLGEYIAHLRLTGLYDRVIAYQVATGTCGEWIKSWSCMGPLCGDYSAPMLRYFRGWLQRKYSTVGALQTAWADPAVTFDTAAVPTADEQFNTTHFLFRDPRLEQKVIDFYACYADVSAEALIELCQFIKEQTQGEKLTGAFFGYLMELSWNDSFFTEGWGDLPTSEVSTIQRSGHLGLQKVLRSPQVDFLVSPYGYAFRGLGGDCLPMQPGESLRIHNKLYLLEEDTLMHNNFDPDGRNQTFDHNIAIYQRNYAQVFTHSLGVTFLESSIFQEQPGNEAEMHRWMKRFQELGEWSLNLERAPSAEVAVFLDDESFFYETIRNHIDLPLIWQQRVTSLNRFGAPHDVYLLNDLLEGRLPPYKLYVFLNPFHLNNPRRQALKTILRQDHRTALWLFAPGYLNADDPGSPASLEHMTDLTGMSFGITNSYWAPFMHITDFTHPITQGLPQDLFWGTTRNLGPQFHLKDPQAVYLGQVVNTLGRCKPGLGVKTFQSGRETWNSVYLATPNIPPAVLRGVARFAGVHLYNEAGDVLYATPHLLGVHSVAGGRRTFCLPRQVEAVYDLYNQRVLAQDAAQFDTTLDPASSRLFYTGSLELLNLLPER